MPDNATVADCLRQHGAEFLRQCHSQVTQAQRQVLRAVQQCRTGALGHVAWECVRCHQQHWVGRSCGNRHCPNCQAEKTQRWLHQQERRWLPVPHFLVTFTVPEELRGLLRAAPRIGYEMLWSTSSQTLQTLLQNPRWLGASQVGFFGVLQTWGRDPLVYHPHIHFVVPGGGLSADGTQWLATPANFLIPAAAAGRVYRQKFREALRDAGWEPQVATQVWLKDWVVDVQPVGDGTSVLKYLAPYVYRVAIHDARILECTDATVTYRYQPSGTQEQKSRTVEGWKFVRGFLQHVLPRGFRKVRYFGWMAAHSRMTLDRIRWLVWLYLGWTYWLGSGLAPPPEPPPSRIRCAHCGAPLQLLAILEARGFALYQRPPPPYHDTG